MGRDNVRVIVKWLVLVKIYGNKPIKLLNKINEKREIKMKVIPFILDGPSNVLNSLWRLMIKEFHKILIREGSIQKEYGIIKIPINVLSQFKDKFNRVVEGSNIENKLVIIFSLKYGGF